MGKSSKTPDVPNYRALAKETAQGNLDYAREATRANRVNQYTPYGSLEFQDLGGGRWSSTQNLSPEQQQLLDLQNQGSIGYGQMANSLLGQAQNSLNQGIDYSGLPNPISGEGVQAAIMSRLEPQLGRQREGLRTQLLNQGIGMGNEAYGTAMNDQSQRENDLYIQAALQGIGADVDARQRGIAEQAYQQDRPIALMNALRQGSAVQGPNFSNVPMQATTAGPDLLGAGEAMYGAQMGQTNARNAQSASNLQAGVGLAGAAAVF